MKIAFANSIGDLCVSADAEYDKVLEAIGSDSRVGNKYFKYGFGYGGPCFPRDNRALGIFSKDMDREVKKDSVLIEESQQLLFALELKKRGYKIKILDDRKEVINKIKSLFKL